jgi:hypothetical protein
MSETRDGDDLLNLYTQKMGRPLGTFFHQLWQDLAHLHLKWNEYVPLFGTSKVRIESLNRAAPSFFGMVQDPWWDDLLLMLWRLTDKDTRTLSICRLPDLTPVSLSAELTPEIADAVRTCKFAHKVRHALIAHRNADVAMKVKPTPKASRAEVRNAIAALDHVFDFVHGWYTKEGPMMWEHLDARGGSEAVLWIVRRGLKAIDDDAASRILPMRFEN